MNTFATPPTAPPALAASGDSRPPHLVGFYLTLTLEAPESESPNAAALLKFAITQALRHQSIAIVPIANAFTINSIRHEILGAVCVYEKWDAIRILQDTFREAGLADHAQIAWCDYAEDYWRDCFPQQPAVTFEKRFETARQWPAQRAEFLAIMKLNSCISRDYLQVVKQRDDLLRDCKVLLAALGHPDAPATPSAAPADSTTPTDEPGK